MVGGSRRQVLVLLTMTTVGVSRSRGQEWLKEQEPAHRTDYLNALEMETLGRNTLHTSEFETSSHSSSVSSNGGEGGDSPTGSVFHEFHGNSSHTDHFKLLKEDGSSVLVGARNVIYNLSLPNLLEFTEEVSQSYLEVEDTHLPPYLVSITCPPLPTPSISHLDSSKRYQCHCFCLSRNAL